MTDADIRITPIIEREITLIRDLLNSKKARDRHGSFVIEGDKVVNEVTAGYDGVDFVVTTRSFLSTMKGKAYLTLVRSRLARRPKSSFEIRIVGPNKLHKMSCFTTTQHLIAVLKKPDLPPDTISRNDQILGVYAEFVQDPGNIGAIVRSCLAFGADALFLSPGCADIFSPKVVTATSGAVLRLPVFSIDSHRVLMDQKFQLYCAVPNGNTGLALPGIREKAPKTVLCFGSEGQGVSLDLCKDAAVLFTIPMKGIESLNVAASAAIALYHFRCCLDLPKNDK